MTPRTMAIIRAMNRHPDTIAAIVLAVAVMIGAVAFLVLHPALYLVP
jgi:hypothetical protein